MPLAAPWSERERSTNPVFPWEWEARYGDGTRFPRVWQGVARLARQAPRAGFLALHVQGPGGVVHVISAHAAESGPPDRIVVEASVVRHLAQLTLGAVTGWRFGFLYRDRFVGLVIDAQGQPTPVDEVVTPARGDARVVPGGPRPLGPAGSPTTRGSARGPDTMM